MISDWQKAQVEIPNHCSLGGEGSCSQCHRPETALVVWSGLPNYPMCRRCAARTDDRSPEYAAAYRALMASESGIAVNPYAEDIQGELAGALARWRAKDIEINELTAKIERLEAAKAAVLNELSAYACELLFDAGAAGIVSGGWLYFLDSEGELSKQEIFELSS